MNNRLAHFKENHGDSSLPIIVTGAGSRLGLCIAQKLAFSGYFVISVCHGEYRAPEVQTNAEHHYGDLTDMDFIEGLTSGILSRHRAIRGIIHNASIWGDDSIESMRKMLALHVEAPFMINGALEPLLRSAFKSDIIHICDDTAMRGTANHIAYAATKAALFNMTLSFAKKFAPNVAVNSVSPGFLLAPEGSGMSYIQQAINKAVIRLEPGPEPLLEAVMYLLESRYTTGTNIIINGGRHLK